MGGLETEWETFKEEAAWPKEGLRYTLACREGWDWAVAAIKGMAVKELERLDREFDGQAMTRVLSDFVDLLEEKP